MGKLFSAFKCLTLWFFRGSSGNEFPPIFVHPDKNEIVFVVLLTFYYTAHTHKQLIPKYTFGNVQAELLLEESLILMRNIVVHLS